MKWLPQKSCRGYCVFGKRIAVLALLTGTSPELQNYEHLHFVKIQEHGPAISQGLQIALS